MVENIDMFHTKRYYKMRSVFIQSEHQQTTAERYVLHKLQLESEILFENS